MKNLQALIEFLNGRDKDFELVADDLNALEFPSSALKHYNYWWNLNNTLLSKDCFWTAKPKDMKEGQFTRFTFTKNGKSKE